MKGYAAMASAYSRRKLDLSDSTKLLAHFWSKVTRCEHGPHCETCCWLWQAGVSSGYGEFYIHRKMIRAHRFIYTVMYGELFPGLPVCHRCDVKLCVNPQHLWTGTQRDNIHDAMVKGRLRSPTSASQKKLYADHPEYIPRGESASGAKTTEAKVLAIRRAYKTNKSYIKLAAEFDVPRSRIWSIVRRRSWRHLPEE
jgi:hypothetical protein